MSRAEETGLQMVLSWGGDRRVVLLSLWPHLGAEKGDIQQDLWGKGWGDQQGHWVQILSLEYQILTVVLGQIHAGKQGETSVEGLTLK